MRCAVAWIALLALAACSTAPGTGWSRASDLSVYGSMHVFKRAALDEEHLCAGFTPASARADWEHDFGLRQEAVTTALAARYGADALADARRIWAPSVACRDLPDARWRARYERQLRLLEIRLELASEGNG
jgi:hypothetical protein